MPNKKSFVPWAAVFLAAGGGLVGYATYAVTGYDIMPPFLQGRQTWFVDMYDAQFVRAYEKPMDVLPEGTVSRNMYVKNYDRMTDAGKALTNPYLEGAELAEVVEMGEWNFQTYCAPCHNSNAMGSGPVNDMSDGKKRFPVPAPALAGSASIISAAGYTKGYVYLTIRNGAAIMPAHGWAMTDQEMWSVTEYLDTLEGVEFATFEPEPAAEDAAMEG
ncbi:MAG: cytochrome c [Myxococcota bacterium]|nr:cytochrome c [Myxococcota bacterium]